MGLGLALGLGLGFAFAFGFGLANPGTPQSMHEAQRSVSYAHLTAQLAASPSHAFSQRAPPAGKLRSSVYCGAAWLG